MDATYNTISKKKSDPVPVDGELKAVSDKRRNLTEERKSLGIFSFKQKKALAEEIAALDEKESELADVAKQQRAELVANINKELEPVRAEIDPLRKQIQTLESEKQSIISKLTQDR